jgi:DNA-binding response OmpR family regulator/two-component sensor histidine kinase
LGGLAWGFYLFRYNLRRNRALRQKSDTYDYVTHEFRTPLTIILGMAELIQNQPKAWLAEGLEKIQRNGVLLLQLVNQLLDISRLDAGLMQQVNWQQGDVLPFLRYLYESFSSYAKSKGINMEFSTNLPELWMDYDPDKLQKIVSNLLSNALKFTPAGGSVYLQVSLNPKSHLLIEVQDTGPGIVEQDLPHIFKRFVRGENALEYQGIGIGLALTKELVQVLGGQIKVDSKSGEGASFKVALPIHKNAAFMEGFPKAKVDKVWTAPPMSIASTGVSDLPLVLIIEDNPDLVDYLRACLQPNYNIAVAPDGEAGIQQAFTLDPDLIISDVMMPKKDGFEVCRTLKNDVRTSHIPIVLLTALSETEDRLRGLEDGADVYLKKPFLQKELEIHLRKALELKEKIKAYLYNPASAAETPTIKKQHEFIRALNAYLEENYARPLAVSELAAAFNLSETQLRGKLDKLQQAKPQRYILQFRLKKAEAQLLFTDDSVEEIAAKTGFSDGSHLSAAFFEEYKMRPGEYRKNGR